ncbi:hypothetical protein AMELA_G00057230 [Ameiurus melas]|uniref:C-C motif chemokine n=1 Tax=Ameiurus melas TaxID=219545 RepID=A0A7J6B0Y6_AMEME|nr:hypothetical protein AMELA_G00057230 [Ameiurus melas]
MFSRCLLLLLVCHQTFTRPYPFGPQCCFRFQTHRIPIRYIAAYKETDHECTNTGIIFTLKSHRHVCVDPGVERVQQAMKIIDQRLYEPSIISVEEGPQCCSSFRTHPIPVCVVGTYEETHINCTKPGIIFTLKYDHRVCTDPGDELVKQAMKRFDQRLFESTIINVEEGPQCCSSFRTHPIPVSVVETYEETHISCTKPGIIFTLKYDHRVCTDPGDEWVKQAMKRYDQRLFESTIINVEEGPQCCSSFRTHPIPVSVVETYEETHISCTKPGIIFTLKYDHRVCTDPGDEWVKQAMKRYDQRLFENEHMPDQCCFSYQTHQIPVRLITEYKKTRMDCPNTGIIFTLRYGHLMCGDPGVEWVKQAMKAIDQRLYETSVFRGKIGLYPFSFQRKRPKHPSIYSTEHCSRVCRSGGFVGETGREYN